MLIALSSIPSAIAAECTCTQNIGHRGTGKNAAGTALPENTIPSFKKAFEEGADMIELDVMHSKDGKLVVIHDPTLDRTTSGKGCVGDRTLAQLQALDAGKGTSMAGQGIRIPTLAEVFAAVPGPVNIELKMSEGTCPATDRKKLAEDVVAAMKAAKPARAFLVSSFDAAALDEVKKVDTTVQLGFLTNKEATATVLADVKRRGFQAVNPAFATVTAANTLAAHTAGLRVYPYTVNAAAEMKRLLTLDTKLAVDGIITDNPDVFVTTQAAACPGACASEADAGAGDGGAADAGPSTDAGGEPATSSDASTDEPPTKPDSSRDASTEAPVDDGEGGCSSSSHRGNGRAPVAFLLATVAALAGAFAMRRRSPPR